MKMRHFKLAAVISAALLGSLAFLTADNHAEAQSRAGDAETLAMISGYRSWTAIHKPNVAAQNGADPNVLAVLSPAEVAT